MTISLNLVISLEAGFRAAAEKFNIPHTVNRAGSMIGFFFTNEKVSNYDKAKTV